MLKVAYVHHNEIVTCDFKYLQQSRLEADRAMMSPDDNVRVTADGYELQQIRQQITGIPMASGAEVVWHGPFAIFILSNIDLDKAVCITPPTIGV